MTILGIDIETYSSIDITKCGVYPYVEAPDFEILLFAYAFDSGPVEIIDLTREALPLFLYQALIDSNVIKTAFNTNFERTCLAKYLNTEMRPEDWRCTMVKSLTLGYPGSLEKVALAMGFPEDKQKDRIGKSLIRYFSVPCKPTKINGGRIRNHPEHDSEKWELYKSYCIQDVEVEREIRKKLASYKTLKTEHALWCLDQRISDQGVNVDAVLVESAIKADIEVKQKTFEEIQQITAVANPNSRVQIKAWVESKLGYELEKFDKDVLTELAKTLTEGEVKKVIKLRQLTSKTSVKKYEKMKMYACKDGRARGILQFYGANRTGRFAGRGIQLQNLPQNHMPDLDDARYLLRSGDSGYLNMIYDDVPDVLSQLIRTAFIPSKGNRFIVSDFSAIEARVIAWIAGEKWRQEVFKTHGKIYEASASAMFNIPIESIKKGSDLRQKGKVSELACLEENTEILTNKGPKKIRDVTLEDRVWDGQTFVSHDGVVFKGIKEVITYEGLTATPDHFVWVCGEYRPIQFGEAAKSGKRLLRSGDVWKGLWQCKNNKCRAKIYEGLEAVSRSNKMSGMWSHPMVKLIKSYKGHIKRMPKLFSKKTCPKMAIQAINCRKISLSKPNKQGLHQLWRKRNRVSVQKCKCSVPMGDGKHQLSQRFRVGQSGQQWSLRSWKSSFCKTQRESGQQKNNHNSKLGRRRLAIFKKCCKTKIESWKNKAGNYRRCKVSSQGKTKELERNPRKARVYDIVNCGKRHRFIANGVLVHNCGFGGGVGALMRMGGDRIAIPKDFEPDDNFEKRQEDYLQSIITQWRKASPKIVKLWWDVDRAAKKAVSDHVTVNLQYGLQFSYLDGKLFVRLPSKRRLCYIDPQILPNRNFGKPGLVYQGMNQITKKWEKIDTYGPKLVENIVQAIARDCLAVSMLRLADEGFNIVFHVHDEVVLDVPRELGSINEVGTLMGEQIEWAPGLLLRADGYECDYYLKD